MANVCGFFQKLLGDLNTAAKAGEERFMLLRRTPKPLNPRTCAPAAPNSFWKLSDDQGCLSMLSLLSPNIKLRYRVQGFWGLGFLGSYQGVQRMIYGFF